MTTSLLSVLHLFIYLLPQTYVCNERYAIACKSHMQWRFHVCRKEKKNERREMQSYYIMRTISAFFFNCKRNFLLFVQFLSSLDSLSLFFLFCLHGCNRLNVQHIDSIVCSAYKLHRCNGRSNT